MAQFIAGVLIVFAVAMFANAASAHGGGTNQYGTHHCLNDDGNQIPGTEHRRGIGYDCPEDGFSWGGVATIIGVALIVHIISGDQSPWGYSPAPSDPNAIDWNFNITPDQSTVTLDIPFDL